MIIYLVIIGVLAIIAPSVLLGFIVNPLFFLLLTVLFVILPAYFILGKRPDRGFWVIAGILILLGIGPSLAGAILVGPWLITLLIAAAIVVLLVRAMKLVK